MDEAGHAPDGAAALDAQARALADLRAAVEATIATLERKPKSAATWHCLGQLLYALGQYDDALEAVDQSHALDEEQAAAWLLKGDILLKMDLTIGAHMAFERALTLAPDDPAARGGTALARRRWNLDATIGLVRDVVKGFATLFAEPWG